MSTSEITNTEDVIDSRDVIARIAELESELEDLQEAVEDDSNEDTLAELQEWEEDYGEELKTLKALEEEASGAADWVHGEALIHEDYFTEYAQQLAEDCGMLEKCENWPNRHIDWEAAAEELQQDYTSVEFDGATYYIRA